MVATTKKNEIFQYFQIIIKKKNLFNVVMAGEYIINIALPEKIRIFWTKMTLIKSSGFFFFYGGGGIH